MPVSIKKLSMKGGVRLPWFNKKPSESSSPESKPSESLIQESKLRESSRHETNSSVLMNNQQSPNPNKGRSRLGRATRRIRSLATKGIGKIRSKIRSLAGKLTKKFKPKNYKQEPENKLDTKQITDAYVKDKLYEEENYKKYLKYMLVENKIPYHYIENQINTVKSKEDADNLFHDAKYQQECSLIHYIMHQNNNDLSLFLKKHVTNFDHLKNKFIKRTIEFHFPVNKDTPETKPVLITVMQHSNNDRELIKKTIRFYNKHQISLMNYVNIDDIPFDYVKDEIDNIQSTDDLYKAYDSLRTKINSEYVAYCEDKKVDKNYKTLIAFKKSIQEKAKAKAGIAIIEKLDTVD